MSEPKLKPDLSQGVVGTGWRGLIATAPLLLIFVGSEIFLQHETRGALRWEAHTLEVQEALGKVLSTMQDIETGQRGFLLTNQEHYLEPFNSGTVSLEAYIATVRRLTTDSLAQQERLNQLEPLIAEKLAEIKQTIKLAQNQQQEAALTIVLTDYGKNVMDQIRILIGRIDAEEDRLLNDRRQRAHNIQQLGTLIEIGLVVLMFVTGLLVYWRVRVLLRLHEEDGRQLLLANVAGEKVNRELQVLTSNLEQRVEKRTRDLKFQTEKLRDSAEKQASLNTELEHQDRVKNRFFSIIAHDLRNPFNVLVGLTDVMSETAYRSSKEQLVGHARRINSSAKITFQLLENLLTWSQLQINGAEFAPQEIDIRGLIAQELKAQELYSQEKEIRLHTDINAHMAFADPYMFQIVVRNLVSNAVKFTPKDGLINVSTWPDGDNIRISVKDNGIGIPAAKLPNIFSIGHNNSTPGTDGEPGTGLGLVLCREMIERNGGEIWSKSKVDEGSEFIFTLPSKARR